MVLIVDDGQKNLPIFEAMFCDDQHRISVAYHYMFVGLISVSRILISVK